MKQFARIIPLIRLPARMGFFDYSVPDDLPDLQRGSLVQITFRGRKIMGLVYEVVSESSYARRVSEIITLVHPEPFLSDLQLQVIPELAHLYHVSFSAIAVGMVPPLQKRMLPKLEISSHSYSDINEPITKVIRYKVTHDLKQYILSAMNPDEQLMIILPLKEYIYEWMAHFENAVRWDSSLSQSDRRKAWTSIRNGAPVVIGNRSMVFLPTLKRAHFVLIDEEHLGHKNWDSQPRYRTYDVVQVRQLYEKCHVTVASRLPRMALFPLPEHTVTLKSYTPTHVSIVDLKRELSDAYVTGISFFAEQAMRDSISRSESALILCGKKGGFHIVRCRGCRSVYTCSECHALLRKRSQRLECPSGHNLDTTIQHGCRTCGDTQLMFGSPGVQEIGTYIRSVFPDTEVSTVTSDTHDSEIATSRSGIMIGTTAIFSRMKFDHFSTVIIVDADILLRMPEYDASERALSVWLSLIYGSGGPELPQVIVQTTNVHHPAFTALNSGSLKEWYMNELKARKALFLPPYSKYIIFSSIRKEDVLQEDSEFAQYKTYFSDSACHVRLPIQTWRRNLMELTAKSKSDVIVDIDPFSVLD